MWIITWKLKYMSRVRWLDRITNEEVRSRCGVENLERKLRKMRLRWFGHVKCVGMRIAYLGEQWSWRWKVEGHQVPMRKKTWSKVVEEDIGSWTSEKIWQRIDISRGNSYQVQPQEWETRDTKWRWHDDDDDELEVDRTD